MSPASRAALLVRVWGYPIRAPQEGGPDDDSAAKTQRGNDSIAQIGQARLATAGCLKLVDG